MVPSIRSDTSAFVGSPMFHRMPRGAAGGTRAAVLRAMMDFAALIALLFFTIPVQADEIEAEPEPKSEPKRVPDAESEEEAFSEPAWIPSIEMGFDAYNYDVDTTIVNLDDPTFLSEEQPEALGRILFRIGGELMGPMFEDLPGRPRLFVQGGVGFATYSEERAFELGNPDDPAEPETGFADYQARGPGQQDLPADFEGQGSWLDADLQDPSWYAGLGIAFSVPTSSGLLFYIKPSVQYSAEATDFKGKLKVVKETSPPGTVDPDPCGPAEGFPACLRTFEVRESHVDFDTTDHSIGPGLEVAMAFLSTRPLRISLFAQVRALWLVSGKTNSVTDPNGIASYSVERDSFGFRGGAGVRLSWVGFD